jgi:DNA-binding LytR/AlgR family response regulator
VVYFEADLKYTTVKTRDRELLLRKPLSELEDELDADRFWRVHRSLIVNVGEVAEARRDLRGRFVLTLRSRPERLRVSQRYAGAFRQM